MKKIAFLFCLAIFTLCASAYASESGRINGSNVRLRAENNTESAILTTMGKDTALTVLAPAGEWYQVQVGGQTGYVLGTYITLDAPAAPEVPAAPVEPAASLIPEAPTAEPIIPDAVPALAVIPNDPPGSAEPEAPAEPETPQTPETGYINGSSVRLRAENNTESAILSTMPLGASVSVLGTAGDWYQIQYAGQTGYVLGTYLSLGASAPVGSGNAELVDWWAEGKSIMSSGTLATVTDVATGISFQIRCMSAGNHADVEPLTAEDNAKILQIRGKYSWTPRAVRVTVNGRVLAASCNGMPHSVSTIKNNDFGGHFCIHFAGSRNHYNNKADPDHQKQVQVAFNS